MFGNFLSALSTRIETHEIGSATLETVVGPGNLLQGCGDSEVATVVGVMPLLDDCGVEYRALSCSVTAGRPLACLLYASWLFLNLNARRGLFEVTKIADLVSVDRYFGVFNIRT